MKCFGVTWKYLNYNTKILLKQKPKKALDYLLEAKRSADFLNEEFYILESSLALGDFYYYNPKNYSEALKEYYKALKIAENFSFTKFLSLKSATDAILFDVSTDNMFIFISLSLFLI